MPGDVTAGLWNLSFVTEENPAAVENTFDFKRVNGRISEYAATYPQSRTLILDPEVRARASTADDSHAN